MFDFQRLDWSVAMTLPQIEEVKGRLPPGWSCHKSQSTGKNYYFNNQTGASVWDIKELPAFPSPPLTPTVAPQRPQATQPESTDPEDSSIEEEIQTLLEQHEKLKNELRTKMSGAVEDRLPSPDLDCASTSEASPEGLRSGIGSKLRRKVNWCHDHNLETEEKKLKVASPVSIPTDVDTDVEETEVETEDNSNPSLEQNLTGKAISSEDEDEESLYGADPEELEALSRMSEKY